VGGEEIEEVWRNRKHAARAGVDAQKGPTAYAGATG
jgi:hypothetical protein